MAIPHNFNPLGIDMNTLDIVRDGLLVWLDGRNAPVGGYWIDRTGTGHHARIYGAVYDVSKKGYYFTSTSASQNTYCMTDTIIPISGDAACTIEAVTTMIGPPKYGPTTSNSVLYVGGNETNLDESTGSFFRIGIRSATGSPAYTAFFGTAASTIGTVTGKLIYYNEKQFFSFAKSLGAFTASQPTASLTACVSGEFYTPTANGNGTFAIIANKLHVGRLAPSGGTVRAMEGIVHCVRIYNRKLTTAEQLQNYFYDSTNL